MAEASSNSPNDSLSVAWSDLVRFVGQLSHDLRNHLNAAELQSAYISELTSDAELQAEIKRLREMISQLGTTLQKVAAGVSRAKPALMPYRAADFVEDLQKKIAHCLPEQYPMIEWNVQVDDGAFNVDPQLLPEAFLELFTNAFQHERGEGVVAAAAKIDNGQFVFTLREPKTRFELSTENWGREPLRTMSRGHYGLGLNRARVIIEAHGGELQAHYDSAASTFVTMVTLPLAQGR